MKAAILDGSRSGEPLSVTRQIIVDELTRLGWQVESFPLCEMKIRHCVGCFGCWAQTPGECLFTDAAREVTAAIIRSDLVVYLTPVTFGGYSSELKKVLDRSICLISPFFTKIQGEVHHKPRYDRYPRLLGVGVSARRGRDEESERIFETLVSRNALNMHAPAHAAGVVPGEGDPETTRTTVRALLHAVEVVG